MEGDYYRVVLKTHCFDLNAGIGIVMEVTISLVASRQLGKQLNKRKRGHWVTPKKKENPLGESMKLIWTFQTRVSRNLCFDKIEETKYYSFLDYLSGGTSVSLIVGIDFTGSNGDPRKPDTLHYMNPNGTPNEYMAALRVIGDVVAPYDSDRWIPVRIWISHK